MSRDCVRVDPVHLFPERPAGEIAACSGALEVASLVEALRAEGMAMQAKDLEPQVGVLVLQMAALLDVAAQTVKEKDWRMDHRW